MAREAEGLIKAHSGARVATPVHSTLLAASHTARGDGSGGGCLAPHLSHHRAGLRDAEILHVLLGLSCFLPQPQAPVKHGGADRPIVRALAMASSSLRSRTEPGSGELHMDALYEILLWLPAKELCRLRVVCRPWRSLLSDPQFIAAHARRHPEPLIVASHNISCECHDEGRVLCDIMDINGLVIKRILATGDEWMLFANLEFACIETGSTKNWHLLNLATGDVFYLPKGLSEEHAEREEDIYDFMATVVFGQVASTGEYKVLRVFDNGFLTNHNVREKLCEVFTLDGSGSARWRGRKAPPDPVCMLRRSRVVVDGIAYFFLDEDFANQHVEPRGIASFDLLTEEWRVTLQGPVSNVVDSNYVYFDNMSLAALNGSLVVVHPTPNGSMDLWFLMDFERGLWIKQYSVQANLNVERYEDCPHPLFILKDGRIVTYIDVGVFRICNPRTNTCTDVAELRHCLGIGLLQPLPVPDQAWAVVNLDFIEGLPKFGGKHSILVVIDKFTKHAHFLPLAHPYTTLQVAQLYFDNIYKLHGLPKIIISDRDRIFTSHLWQELFKLIRHSAANELSLPSTNGWANRKIESMP
ncbi:hypothetical protein U9M48_004515 [Paspalum notatum var. saurae]|uniref:Integrase catalytic domain-containing protein n=1 Tax=Paspalum notatum var. saurae TaxID=547442 RepID=A0AAQ3SJ47_PASNO